MVAKKAILVAVRMHYRILANLKSVQSSVIVESKVSPGLMNSEVMCRTCYSGIFVMLTGFIGNSIVLKTPSKFVANF